MKTLAFLQALRAHPALPVVFRHGGDTVPSGYHLTEVKRVAYETMDCGAKTHRWSETQFEIWVPPLNSFNPWRGYMPAGKILAIIESVERALPLTGDTDARIHTQLGAGAPSLWEIATAAPSGDQLVVSLTPDRTRCKAAERQLGQLTGGCCGSKPEIVAGADAGCACAGAGLAPAEKEAAVCCS